MINRPAMGVHPPKDTFVMLQQSLLRVCKNVTNDKHSVQRYSFLISLLSKCSVL